MYVLRLSESHRKDLIRSRCLEQMMALGGRAIPGLDGSWMLGCSECGRRWYILRTRCHCSRDQGGCPPRGGGQGQLQLLQQGESTNRESSGRDMIGKGFEGIESLSRSVFVATSTLPWWTIIIITLTDLCGANRLQTFLSWASWRCHPGAVGLSDPRRGTPSKFSSDKSPTFL